MSLKTFIGEGLIAEIEQEQEQPRGGLKDAHYEHCRREGLTDEEIEKDWQEFEKGYVLFSNITCAEGGSECSDA